MTRNEFTLPPGLVLPPGLDLSADFLRELWRGEGIGLATAARLVPGEGKAVTTISCLTRWAKKGCVGRRLEHLRRESGQMITTAGAVVRYLVWVTIVHEVRGDHSDAPRRGRKRVQSAAAQHADAVLGAARITTG